MPFKQPASSRIAEETVGFIGQNCKKVDEKCLSKVAVGLSVITLLVVLLLLFAATLFVYEQQNGQLPEIFIHQEKIVSPPPTFACVPCVKLLQNPTDRLERDSVLGRLTVKVTDEGREDCCASSSDEISALFQAVMRLSASPHPTLPSLNLTGYKFSPVSAHKRLYPEKLSDNFGVPNFPSRPRICELKEDDHYYGLEHHRGVNITKSKTGLRILHGGLYYIYTSIEFRPQSMHPCKDFKYQTFNGYVERRSWQSSKSGTLLKVTHTCCDRCNNYQETGFTGGVFYLEPGDLILVRVSGYELVHFQPETSFMGLAMLGSFDSGAELQSE